MLERWINKPIIRLYNSMIPQYHIIIHIKIRKNPNTSLNLRMN
jgi:hypothetical protein